VKPTDKQILLLVKTISSIKAVLDSHLQGVTAPTKEHLMSSLQVVISSFFDLMVETGTVLDHLDGKMILVMPSDTRGEALFTVLYPIVEKSAILEEDEFDEMLSKMSEIGDVKLEKTIKRGEDE